MYDRAIKYKHQQEVRANWLLADQFYRIVSGIDDLDKIKQSISENISSEFQPGEIFAIIDKQRDVVFHYAKQENILNNLLAKIKVNSTLYEGQINQNNADYSWFIRDLTADTNKKYSLLIIYPLFSSVMSDVLKFFGLPFFISGLLLCWVMVWASIILSSLVTKLENQKLILSEQAAEIEKARDEAMRASSVKSDFLANMSHEIRTPLTAIIGFAETSLEPNQLMQERLKATKTIIKSGKHLMHIINEILDLTKVEAGKLEVEIIPFSIMDTLEEINQLVSVMAEEKGLTFTINYSFPVPDKILSDQFRIKQVLLNLCSNAIKFTVDGHVYLNVSYKQDSSILILEIIDTGIGMSEVEKEKIFKPFEQADSSTTRKFGGTGLGLTLSKKLIEMLNGSLSVDSTEKKGSRFTVELEVAEVERGSYLYESAYKENLVKNIPLNTNVERLIGKVLIAEDNEDIRDLVRLLFNKVGIEPDLVENGKKAVELATSSNYDLIFLDIQMPVMDGYTAIGELRKLSDDVPIVAMTANAMNKDRAECNKKGFSDFISKPIDRNALYSVLTKYLKQGQIIESDNTLLTSKLIQDDPDLIDLIDRFISRLPTMSDAINQAHSEKKEKELSGLIHQMKGVGGNYGYPMLTELCAKIEFQIKNKDTKNLATLIEEFNLMVEQILNGKDENHKIVENLNA